MFEVVFVVLEAIISPEKLVVKVKMNILYLHNITYANF